MKEPTKNYGFRAPVELMEKLQYIAAYDCRSRGSMLRVLVYDCVERFEKEHGEILSPHPVDFEKSGE